MVKGKLFVLSGPSGTGKGTICREVLSRNNGIRLSISMTTRTPREGEIHGEHYFFAEREEFISLINEDGFIEYADVYGNFYGTPKKQVEEWLDRGQDVLLEIDVQGAIQVKKNYPDSILLFVLPPSIEVLRERLTGRGTDAADVIERRMASATSEIGLIGEYDYSIVNDVLAEAVESVEAIIKGEHMRLTRETSEAIVRRYKQEV
ncbi:MAG: guanylate kinase [Bacillota bacterium]|nr:guanylate kinase [Bacillota bacterium]